MKLTPAASTRTSSWPGPGVGTGTSSYRSTSGPPVAWTRMAFTAAPEMDEGIYGGRVRGGGGRHGLTPPAGRRHPCRLRHATADPTPAEGRAAPCCSCPDSSRFHCREPCWCCRSQDAVTPTIRRPAAVRGRDRATWRKRWRTRAISRSRPCASIGCCCAEVTAPETPTATARPTPRPSRFALPACSFTGFRGGTLEITGTIVISDPTPEVPDFAYQATLDDLTWRLTSPNQRLSYTAVRNGTRVLTGNAAGLALSNNITVDRTYPVRDPSTRQPQPAAHLHPGRGRVARARRAAARRDVHQERDLHLEPERSEPHVRGDDGGAARVGRLVHDRSQDRGGRDPRDAGRRELRQDGVDGMRGGSDDGRLCRRAEE